MAKPDSSTSHKAHAGTTKGRRKPIRSFNAYIYRALKQIHKDVGFSSKGMKVLNSFVYDMFERLAVEGAALTRFNKSKTFTSREVQTAVRLLLPRN